MLNSASADYREKRQIVIQNVESAVFYDSGDSEDKRTELVLLEAEIAKRISNGDISDLNQIETGYVSAFLKSDDVSNIKWKSSALKRKNILSSIEKLTFQLLTLGDTISVTKRKRLLNEISEKVLLLQIKDFC